MPAKKTRQPAKAVRYLLSADQKFRRLSLKRISERVKTARRRARGSSTAKRATSSQSVSRATRNPAPWRVAPIAFMLVGLVALAALVRASWPSSSVDAQNVDTQVADAPAGSPVVLTADVASAPAVSVKTPASSVDPRITSEQASGAAVSTAEVSALAVSAKKPAPSPVVKTLNAAPAPAPATSRPVDTAAARVETAPAPPPPITSPADAPPALTATTLDTVTISGCLDYDGKSVWLKDASGVEAPRTRSWRSGFLKKRSPRIALVNGPTSASAYAGRRVSVTGVLVDREMHVDSLQPIASDCE